MSQTRDKILDVTAVAEMLNVAECTIYAMANSGTMPACKMGGQWRFVESTILEWIKQGERANMDRREEVEEATSRAGAAPRRRRGVRRS